jgi:hypothetical protein
MLDGDRFLAQLRLDELAKQDKRRNDIEEMFKLYCLPNLLTIPYDTERLEEHKN